jgi:hypothetical protein
LLPAHGWELEHPPAHAAPEQVLGAQLTVCIAGHAPFPSQLAATVAVPFEQLAVLQVAVGYAHAVRVIPSQLPPQVLPAPAQAVWPLRGAPVTATHIPLLDASAHASQDPPQAALQQTPSAQKPLAHWVPAVQVWPDFSLQAPVASHDLVPLQLSASSAPVTAVHVPPPAVQAWQAPHEGTPQQRPSTQAPLLQSAAAAHVCPLLLLQAPCASHVRAPLQLSSIPDFTGLHVPRAPVRLHAVQVPPQAALQQTPSAQKPLLQSPAFWQVWPLAFLATHLPARQ